MLALDRTRSIGSFEDHLFRERIFSGLPYSSMGLANRYIEIAKTNTKRDANLYLLDCEKHLKRYDLELTASDSSIRDFCKAKADAARDTLIRLKTDEVKLEAMLELTSKYEIELPSSKYGVEPVFQRLKCSGWWRRQVRKLQAREVEQFAINRGRVRRGRDVYLSDWNVNRRQKQIARNRAMLEQNEAVNQYGDSYTLAELSDLGVSNPKIRRAELMVRMRGFEEVANRRNHVGVFYTITCPSKMHPTSEKYNGTTPKQAQDYLSRVWARIRAKCGRDAIRFYGFRVAEPHHDGCPHWHCILFCCVGDVDYINSVIRSHSLATDGNEKGAETHRVTQKIIDKSKGSATGYIAKYISKNIDGDFRQNGEVGIDNEAGDYAYNTVVRVEAWAATHGIRQFQQVGGPSVTVWRELRRIRNEEKQGDLFESTIERAAKASDVSDWADYVEVMGGPCIPRSQRPITLLTFPDVNEETGEIPINAYGEPVPNSIRGIECGGETVITRIYEWKIRKKNDVKIEESDNAGHKACEKDVAGRNNRNTVSRIDGGHIGRGSGHIARVKNRGATGGAVESRARFDTKKRTELIVRSYKKSGVGLAEFDLPWSSVNNCTRDRKNE